ncbi:MAG: 4Fe-4S cluster-binding domain-containing protein, partial [Eubacterium sp.]|nr:4Fe-4S cluster-binding domain-containing protein [Eubacterium sp.]
MICSICPRHCNVDRDNIVGYCQSKNTFRVARAALHFWEEPFISGKNGSGTVFFSGCNLRCAFCQNCEISRDNKGVDITDERLVEIFEQLIKQGAENINLVNPTHYADRLAAVLSKWHRPVPIVYNSSGYEEVETLKKLSGLIDVYLPDLKYIRADKSLRYSKAEDYFDKASAAILEMRRQVEDSFEGDMMKSGLIVRHLILPQNTNSSIAIIDWFKNNLPDTYLSLMAQYVPCGRLDDLPEINRTITKREYDKVVDYALLNAMDKLFIQELSSADAKFIPPFD